MFQTCSVRCQHVSIDAINLNCRYCEIQRVWGGGGTNRRTGVLAVAKQHNANSECTCKTRSGMFDPLVLHMHILLVALLLLSFCSAVAVLRCGCSNDSTAQFGDCVCRTLWSVSTLTLVQPISAQWHSWFVIRSNSLQYYFTRLCGCSIWCLRQHIAYRLSTGINAVEHCNPQLTHGKRFPAHSGSLTQFSV